jgi:tetratricopeptide (TPR) repeat protein
MSECKDLTDCEKCLALIARGSDALSGHSFTTAEASFRMAMMIAQSTPPEQARDLLALALYYLSLLRQRQGRLDESQELRAQAKSRLNENAVTMQLAIFQHLMASVLSNLGEYRRAIPFWEAVIQSEGEFEDPLVMADILWRAGECYSRTGLKDHAAIPLRAAVRFFRNQTADPRLPAVLVALGNALRKTVPAEAESCYQEAADLHVARGQMQSATPAWVNLGILCSEQGRHSESLEYNERVLRLREQSPGTPPGRIASVLNNIANCYRRMGRFAEAHTSVTRAIGLIEKDGGAELAAAYGTRGLIFRDQGLDHDAVEWLRNAYAEHQKLPSPNLNTVAEDFENEIAALKRSGRAEEAATAEEQLSAVQTTMSAVPAADYDLKVLDSPTREAVLVELDFGNAPGRPYTKSQVAKFADGLSDIVEAQSAGLYAGSVTIRESTSLLFYGADAEVLFQILEPNLLNQPMCAGARVTIRRLSSFREVVVPQRLT